MSRLLRALVVAVAVVPAVGVLVAVQATPRSAYSIPSFEIRTPTKPIRLSAVDLGVYRSSSGIRVDRKTLDHTISRLNTLFRVAPTADAYALEGGRVVLKPGHSGIELDRAATRELLIGLVHGSATTRSLPVRRLPARPAPQDAIVVKLSYFRLDLYRRTRAVDHFTVGVGRLRFATPPGVYYVKYKERNPAWRNPGSAWARYMPSYMPPGPRNPLGSRALGLDRGALVIHGTPEPWTVGTRSSHGCIRMRKGDVEKLFELVPQGTPVFIVP